jgi:hypothetical protein
MSPIRRLALAAATAALAAAAPSSASAQVVISQIYGAGGNAGAVFANDFVELFNRGSTAVSLTGYSLQYASTGGNFASGLTTALTGSIGAGRYFLIQLASGGASGAALPTPDAVGTTNISATVGKLLLANTTTAFTTSCPLGSAAIVDFVGYGAGTNCFEGAGTAPSPSATTAIFRAGNGATDTNNNAADFAAAAPTPRNSAFQPAVVPEPGTLALLALGGVGLLGAARRRRAA